MFWRIVLAFIAFSAMIGLRGTDHFRRHRGRPGGVLDAPRDEYRAAGRPGGG